LIAVEYHGPNYTFDDANYVHYGKQILAGNFSPFESPYALGYVMPGTVAESFLIFGENNLAASIPSMVEYLALIIVTYFTLLNIERLDRFAFQTSIILAISAFVAVYTSRVLSDMLIGLIVAVSLYIISKNDRHPMLAGAVLGVIIFVKFGGLVASLAVLVAVIATTPKKYSARFFAGLAILTLIYMTSIGWNIHAIEAYSANQVNLSKVDLRVNLITMSVMMFFNYGLNKHIFDQVFPLGAIAFYAVIGAIMIVAKRDRRAMLFMITMAFAYLYLFFGTESISTYKLITVVERYMIWIALPIAVTAAYFISELYDWSVRRSGKKYATIVIISIVLLALLSNLPMLIIFHYKVFKYP
jgi:hypothetical protein